MNCTREFINRELSSDPNPQYFLKSTAVQMGGVLPHKWEAYCSTNGRCTVGFPFLQGLEGREVQRYEWGAYCRTNWRCTAALFPRPVGVGVYETLLNTMRHKNITYPKNFYPNYFQITVARSEFFSNEFRKITRYLLYLCELRDITRQGPLPLSNYFISPLPDLKFSELIG